jgi:hypothetical protein
MPDYIWSLDVTYPEDAHWENPWVGRDLNPDWEPANWAPDEEYVAQFKTERFIWPAVRRFYLSRSSAVDRAKLLEFYGCKVRLLRSKPIEFEERNYKHRHQGLRLVPGGAA